MEDLKSAFDSYKSEIIDAKGITCSIDGIECYGLYGKIKKISFQEKVVYKGIGESIFVDKNHDLSYYFAGSDYVNETESSSIINTSSKYGYEWGGYDTSVYTAADIGSGLSNTNSLIEMDLQPHTSSWHVVWNKIKEFRQNCSDKWFLPSKDELNLIYEARANLSNLSTSTIPYYWSSSEYPGFDYSSYFAWYQSFNYGFQYGFYKYAHNRRSRLCVQF